MRYDNAVVLLPGFFGFGRLGNFYYFADRVAAVLRGAAEVRFGKPTPVMGLSTRPTGSLGDRQKYLLDRLRAVDVALGRAGRFHLVGHSTGGVDAELLLAERPLDGRDWATLDPLGVRERIASITTIAAPHYGTYLACSNVVGFLLDPRHNASAWKDTTALVAQLVKLAGTRPLVGEAAFATVQSSASSARFVLDVLTHDALLRDLQPATMEALRRQPPALRVPVSCFVTAVPEERSNGVEPIRPSDSFFRILHELTGRVEGPLSENLSENCKALSAAGVRLVKNAEAGPLHVDAHTNDGVVNSMSQLLRTSASKLAAIVVADHADVLGHYDRADPLTDGTTLNEGFFRSGARFGDDEFFALYGLVAEAFPV